jgi:hypothetical protein
MSNEMSPQRKKVVILGAAIACMSGGPVLLMGHPKLLGVWVGVMLVALVRMIAEIAKLKRQGQ